jgi:hypothetical protein
LNHRRISSNGQQLIPTAHADARQNEVIQAGFIQRTTLENDSFEEEVTASKE